MSVDLSFTQSPLPTTTAPRAESKPAGFLIGLPIRGTGSEEIWIRTPRWESIKPQELCTLHTVAPVYLLRKIRRISGLTWEELSIAMGVTRRTLHLWDAGQELSQKHLNHLHRVAGLLDRLDRGNPVLMRNHLLKDFEGQNALSMLKEGNYSQVESLLAATPAFPKFIDLPETEARRRRPLGSPLASYRDQSVQIVSGRALKGIKTPKIQTPE